MFHGTGGEFRDFKPYVPGDDIRRMDWLVTARRQSPYVRRYVEERQLRVILAVDASLSMHDPCPGGSAWDTALRVSAALALAAAWNNDRVGTFAFSGGMDLCCPPRAGERHALSIVRDLLACRPKGRSTDPTPVLRRLARIRRHALVFLISDLLTVPGFGAPQAASLLAGCAERHRLIIVRTAARPAETTPRLLVNAVDRESGRRRVWNTRLRDWTEGVQSSSPGAVAGLGHPGVQLVDLPPGKDCITRLAAALRAGGGSGGFRRPRSS
jgi:uncharacterized protein (DUF58 family)